MGKEESECQAEYDSTLRFTELRLQDQDFQAIWDCASQTLFQETMKQWGRGGNTK